LFRIWEPLLAAELEPITRTLAITSSLIPPRMVQPVLATVTPTPPFRSGGLSLMVIYTFARSNFNPAAALRSNHVDPRGPHSTYP
jgi:hypothetical protein